MTDRPTAAETALRAILNDVRVARWHQQNKGGQQCGGPPPFWNLPPSTMRHLERTCCNGLGVGSSAEEIARQLAIYDRVSG